MSNFNMLRMKTYLEHLCIGVVATLLSVRILAGIVSEMLRDYDSTSLNAYVWGLIICGIVFIFGLYMLIVGGMSKHRMFDHMSQDEIRQFYKELHDETTLYFGNRLIITRHYIVAYTRNWRPSVYIIQMNDLVACFGQESTNSLGVLIGYRLTLVDRKFRKIEYETKGAMSEIMQEGYKALLSLSPWVFSDNYDEFINSYKRKSKSKAYLKEIELRRRQEDELPDDTLPLQMVTAADIIRKYNEQQSLIHKASADTRVIFQRKKED